MVFFVIDFAQIWLFVSLFAYAAGMPDGIWSPRRSLAGE